MSVSRQRRHLQLLLLLLFLQSTIHAPSPIVAAQEDANGQHSNDAHEQARRLLTNYFDNILNLQFKYPELVTVQDATDAFPILINSAPSCPFVYDKSPAGRCFTPIVTVYDAISNSPNQASLGAAAIALPQILLTSAPNSQMDLLSLFSMYQTLRTLLECAHCESLSPYVNTTNTSEAIECRQSLRERGIDDTIRKWMARLVVTREIVFVPIVDVGGFYHRLVDELSDGSYDMNTPDESNMMQFSGGVCDFPSPIHWSDHAESACMNTYPARIINELFRSHSFQLGLSFYQSADSGYIEIPSWETGDEVAMNEISTALAQFGAGMNSQPYEVRVANVTNIKNNTCITMEHWAFSAGFSGITFDMEGQINLEQCVCESQDGSCDYPMERTSLYDGSSLRSFMAKVVSPPLHTIDISNLPGYDTPSSQSTMFDPTTLGAQIRTSLIAIDLLQPWTSITSIADVSIRDDIVPLSPRYTESCTHTKVMKLPTSPSNTNVTVKWTVGGSINIDETAIMYGEWNVLDKKIFNCVSQPTKEELDTFFAILRDFEEREGETEEEMETEVTFTPVQSGHSAQNDADGVMPETTFTVSLDLSRYKVGDVIAVYALARVDQKWAQIISEEEGTSSPAESNIVNARTNPEWTIYQRHGNDGSTIRGQLDFFSIPVTIEMENRPGFFEGTEIIDASVRLSDVDFIDEQDEEDGIIVYALFMAVVTIVVVFLCTFCREQSDGTDVLAVLSARRKIMHQRISVDEFFRNEAAVGNDLELT